MRVHVDEVASRVGVADGESLLTPALLQRVVEAVMTRLERQEHRRQLAEADTAYRRSASDDPSRTG
jgi:hypothetical protein